MSPKIEVLALCNYASFNKDGAMSIVDIFDEIYADELPASFPRCFLAIIASAEPDSELKLKVQITPVGQFDQTLERLVTVTTGTNARGNFILEMVNLNLPFKGDYEIRVLHKEHELGSSVFKVIENQKTSMKSVGKYIN